LKKFAFAADKLKGLMQSKEERMKDDLTAYSSMVFDEVSQFITFFINFNLPFDMANKLLKETTAVFIQDKNS
jgi:hypothetical protein